MGIFAHSLGVEDLNNQETLGIFLERVTVFCEW